MLVQIWRLNERNHVRSQYQKLLVEGLGQQVVGALAEESSFVEELVVALDLLEREDLELETEQLGNLLVFEVCVVDLIEGHEEKHVT